MSGIDNPNELLAMEAEEQAARERLEAHRAEVLEQDGEAPRNEDRLWLEHLEQEWKHAVERLERARKAHKG